MNKAKIIVNAFNKALESTRNIEEIYRKMEDMGIYNKPPERKPPKEQPTGKLIGKKPAPKFKKMSTIRERVLHWWLNKGRKKLSKVLQNSSIKGIEGTVIRVIGTLLGGVPKKERGEKVNWGQVFKQILEFIRKIFERRQT